MMLLLSLLLSCDRLSPAPSLTPVGGPPADLSEVSDEDGDGYSTPADCDDADARVNPGAAEVCANQADDDCDGQIDAESEGCAWVGDWETSSADLELEGGWNTETQVTTIGSVVVVPRSYHAVSLVDVTDREANTVDADTTDGLRGVSYLRSFADPATGANALGVFLDDYQAGRAVVGALGAAGAFESLATVTFNPGESSCTFVGTDAVGLSSADGMRLAISCTSNGWPNPDAPPSYVYVFNQGLSGSAGIADASLTVAGTYWQFGADVNAADLTGDGVDDLVVGSPDWVHPDEDLEYADYGRIFVFDGLLTGAVTDEDADFFVNPVRDGILGHSSAPLGDVDGDGYDDIAVSDGHGAYVLRGPLDTDRTVDDAWASYLAAPGAEGTQPGWALSAAGDVDGEGSADLLVGAPWSNDGGAYLVYGVAAGNHSLVDDSAFFSGAGSPGMMLGASDLDGDGLSDVVLGYAIGPATAVFFGRGR